MRTTILVALLIAMATLVGCKDQDTKPTESSMNSMDTQSMEKSKEKMNQSPEAMEDTAAAAETPASGDAAGTAQ